MRFVVICEVTFYAWTTPLRPLNIHTYTLSLYHTLTHTLSLCISNTHKHTNKHTHKHLFYLGRKKWFTHIFLHACMSTYSFSSFKFFFEWFILEYLNNLLIKFLYSNPRYHSYRLIFLQQQQKQQLQHQ